MSHNLKVQVVLLIAEMVLKMRPCENISFSIRLLQ